MAEPPGPPELQVPRPTIGLRRHLRGYFLAGVLKFENVAQETDIDGGVGTHCR